MLEIFEILILSIIIGVNFFSLLFLFVVLCSHYVKGMPSPTMKIATIAWLTGLGSISFGVFSFANYSLFIGELSFADDWKIGAFARLFLLYGAFLFRFSVFAAVIERGITTFMLKTYTKYILRNIIMILFLIICPILQLIAYYKFNLTKIKLTGMVLFTDTVSFTICLLIRYYNRKLRRRRLSIELSLAERYQVNENIRFLHVILPSASVNWFFQSLLGITSIIDASGIPIVVNNRMLATHLNCHKKQFKPENQEIKGIEFFTVQTTKNISNDVLIFNQGYTILVVLSLFIPSIIDGSLAQKISCFAPAFKDRIFTVIVHPSRDVTNKPDTDVYFNAYQKSWNRHK